MRLFNVKISQTNAHLVEDDNFDLTYNIDAGKNFFQ